MTAARALQRQSVVRILTMALPVLVGMLSQTAINILDTYLVGLLPSDLSVPGQAALGLSLPLLWAVGGFLSAISVGTQALTARREGEGNPEAAGKVLFNSLTVAAISGAVFTVLSVLAVPTVFPYLHNNPRVIELGVPYCQVRLLGVLTMVVTMSLKSFFDGIGKTTTFMVASIIMNIGNVAFAYAFIFGAAGFPRLEVTGAAAGAVVATAIGIAVLAIQAARPAFRRRYLPFRWSNFEIKTCKEIARLSVPSGLATVFVMTGFLMFFKIVSLVDADASGPIGAFAASSSAQGLTGDLVLHIEADRARLRASKLKIGDGGSPCTGSIDLRTAPDASDKKMHFTAQGGSACLLAIPALQGNLNASWTEKDKVAFRAKDLSTQLIRLPVYSNAAKLVMDILSLVFISCLAFGTATATLVSQSLGAGNPDQAERYGWDSTILGSLIFGALGFTMTLWPDFYLYLLNKEPAVADAGRSVLRLMGAMGWLIAIAMITTQALFGAGNTRFVMVAEMILHAVCLVPCAYLFGVVLHGGMFGTYLSAVLYIVLLAGVMGWKFRQGSWKQIRI